MRRIDLFTLFSKRYTYESYVSRAVSHFFNEKQISHDKTSLDKGNFGSYLAKNFLQAPQATLSFVDLFPGEPPLCQLLNTPHFCWPQKGLHEVFSLFNHPLGKIGVQNKKQVDEIRKKGFSNVHYLPWGIPLHEKGEPENQRRFDIVLFDDLIDLTALKKTWLELFTDQQVEILEQAFSICQKGRESPLNVLFNLFAEKEISLEEIHFPDLLFSLEEALKSEKIAQLIASISSVRIDVFGEHVGNNWLCKLKNAENVYLHWSLPYTDYFEILKQSRILLRYVPLHFDGWDEWTLPALNLGCAVLTNGCPVMKEEWFQHYPDFTYLASDFSLIGERLQHLLKEVRKRETFLEESKKGILTHYTWEKSIESLIQCL